MSLDSILRSNPNKVTIPYSGSNIITYPYENTTQTINGVTFTDNGDGTITANGTADSNAVFWLFNSTKTVSQWGLDSTKNYFFRNLRVSGKDDSGSTIFYAAIQYRLQEFEDTGEGVILEKPNAQYPLGFKIVVLKGKTINNVTFYPQLLEKTEDNIYEKYSANTGNREVLKVSYGSRNLWQNTNTTFPSTLSYDSNTQTYTIGTGTAGYQFVAYKLDNPIPAGTVVTISAYFQSGKGVQCAFGGYHRTGGTSWQGYLDIPANTDMTGQILTATFTTTETVEEFEVFHNTGGNVEEAYVFQVQYEFGDKATEYVPYNREVVWIKKENN